MEDEFTYHDLPEGEKLNYSFLFCPVIHTITSALKLIVFKK
jgi:hypothetical protein